MQDARKYPFGDLNATSSYAEIRETNERNLQLICLHVGAARAEAAIQPSHCLVAWPPVACLMKATAKPNSACRHGFVSSDRSDRKQPSSDPRGS